MILFYDHTTFSTHILYYPHLISFVTLADGNTKSFAAELRNRKGGRRVGFQKFRITETQNRTLNLLLKRIIIKGYI